MRTIKRIIVNTFLQAGMTTRPAGATEAPVAQHPNAVGADGKTLLQHYREQTNPIERTRQ